jgi:hypothetical protein
MSVIDSLPSTFNPGVAAALPPVCPFSEEGVGCWRDGGRGARLVNVDALIRNWGLGQ